MADQRGGGISWTDETWNPVRGCSRASQGCVNCYAEKMAARFCGPGQPYDGLVTRKGGEARWTGKVVVVEDHLLDPLRWRRPRRIFVNSMSDLFHPAMSDADIDRIFAVMALAPRHTFQILTKRPERMRRFMTAPARPGRIGRAGLDLMRDMPDRIGRELLSASVSDAPAAPAGRPVPRWPLPNVWLGTSVEDQKTAVDRIPDLLRTPAAIRFISAEPLLDFIDLRNLVVRSGLSLDGLTGGWRSWGKGLRSLPLPEAQSSRLDLVIAGGESGLDARPVLPDMVRELRDACAATGTAFHFKQWGEWAPGECADRDIRPGGEDGAFWSRSGGWRIQHFSRRRSEELHVDDEPDVWRIGKKQSGRALDGVIHDAMPRTGDRR